MPTRRVCRYATGYRIEFPFLDASCGIEVSPDNEVSLYKYMFPVDADPGAPLGSALPQLSVCHRPTSCRARVPLCVVGVIGLVQPLGSIMPVSEMQARVFCSVLAGTTPLPPKSNMIADMNSKALAMQKRYRKSPRHTIQVCASDRCTRALPSKPCAHQVCAQIDYLPYMDEMSRLIGCQPRIWKHLLRNPRFGLFLIFGPVRARQFHARSTAHVLCGSLCSCGRAITGVPVPVPSGRAW